jgi:hypothetical protein
VQEWTSCLGIKAEKRLRGLSPAALLIVGLAAVKAAIHLLTSTTYGYFGDELYTIAMSRRLAFGYLDLPPLVPALIALARAVLGDSLFAMHIVPTLAGAGTLVFVCLITREMGGKLSAVALSGLAFIVVPLWLTIDSFFCYDSIDQLVLASFLYVLVRFIKSGNKKSWILLGILAGVACMTKPTILFMAPGFIVALLVSKYRKHFLTPWPWLAIGIFFVIISPYVIWQYVNHWPTAEYWLKYESNVYHYNLWEYLVNIILTMNPMLFPLILIGIYRIFRRFGDTSYRILGIMFLVTLVLIFFIRGRNFMSLDLFIPIIAAGAIFLEELLAGPGLKKALRIAAFVYLAAAGALVAPANLQIVPINSLSAWADKFGFLYQPVKDYTYPKPKIPQEFAMRIGWENLVQVVARVYDELPQEDRAKAGIYADWYGPAGAIDLFGPKYGLPHAVSGHKTYYLWGPGDYSWDVMIMVTSLNVDRFRSVYAMMDMKAVVPNELAMPWDTRLGIYVCKFLTMPKESLWTLLKAY